MKKTIKLTKRSAIIFIILFGLVSLFADMNYEGGRSVVGQFLKLLGSSAFAIGLAAGIGEFAGYALRFVSGSIADKTRKYWIFIIAGYTLQLCSLPMLAFLDGWELAVAFLFFERVGKAVRKPAHDAVISFASSHTGSGFGFGLHEAMDQIGAFVGPALFSILLFTVKSGTEIQTYRNGLLLLFIPAALAIGITVIARFLFPHPEKFEIKSKTPELSGKGYSRPYWIIVIAAGLLAMGITDFPLIGLHLKKTGAFTEEAIPLLYAGAMAIDAAAAIFFGFLYDRIGIKALAEGLALIEKAIALKPDAPAILDSLGWALHRLGRDAEALPHLQRAFEIQRDAEIGAHLATVLAALGQADEARSILRLAREIDPKNRTLLRVMQALSVEVGGE